jgi:drug/metabolite transporter (DMT)-like permease
MVWLVLVVSIAAVALMYWLIRRSAATRFASLFYLVPVVTALFAYLLFGERLDSISILGMLICTSGVALVSRGIARPTEAKALGLNVPATMQARVDEMIE